MATTNKEAVKTEEKKVNNYELVFIVKPDVTDEALEAIIGNITQFVTAKGGTVASNDKWGKKKLAYPLKHSLEGNYVLSKFSIAPTWSRELENNLFINDQILRHLLIKVE
ncbi:MAG: 30S ribosomal protein S6 [Dehalococcoidales bacterium]|nr:30S ribosomal protein S6 [Dehalococcoidales bacterium]